MRRMAHHASPSTQAAMLHSRLRKRREARPGPANSSISFGARGATGHASHGPPGAGKCRAPVCPIDTCLAKTCELVCLCAVSMCICAGHNRSAPSCPMAAARPLALKGRNSTWAMKLWFRRWTFFENCAGGIHAQSAQRRTRFQPAKPRDRSIFRHETFSLQYFPCASRTPSSFISIAAPAPNPIPKVQWKSPVRNSRGQATQAPPAPSDFSKALFAQSDGPPAPLAAAWPAPPRQA